MSSNGQPNGTVYIVGAGASYLAYICYYTKLNGQPPAEHEMVPYFHVSPPSVHQMVVAPEKRCLIDRTPGQARSIRLLLGREELPDLE